MQWKENRKVSTEESLNLRTSNELTYGQTRDIMGMLTPTPNAKHSSNITIS